MKAPALTEEMFAILSEKGMAAHKAISKYNSTNCRKTFVHPFPIEGTNATLCILNHKGRYKYMGFMANANERGDIIIVKTPELIFTGYVFFNDKIYAVNGGDLISGTIKAEKEISFELAEA